MAGNPRAAAAAGVSSTTRRGIDTEEGDFQRIEETMTRLFTQFRNETRLETQQFRDEIVSKFDRAIGTTEGNLQRRLDLLAEGHQMLAEKLDEILTLLKADIAKVDQRVTAVAADLSAHRRDTEAHRKVWRMRDDAGGE